jgi:hypothetical protein
VFRNDYCICETMHGNPECWRALCGECGNYLAFHMATMEAAQAQAQGLIDTGHHCGRFTREGDDVHRYATRVAQAHARRRGAW